MATADSRKTDSKENIRHEQHDAFDSADDVGLHNTYEILVERDVALQDE